MEATITRWHSADRSTYLTVEQALYIGLFAAAAVLRLWNLSSTPLDTTESHAALQSWSIYKAMPATAQDSPLLIYLNSLVFLVFGASDASARALPALAGSALAVLPYFGRRYVGRSAALVAAVLLAFSPTMVFFSRYVGEATLVAVLSLGLACSFALYVRASGEVVKHASATEAKAREGRGFLLYLTAALLGLLLASGRTAYLNAFLFVAFLLGLVLLQRFGSRIGWSIPDELRRLPKPDDIWPGNYKAQRWAIVFVATLAISLTGGLTNLHGIQEGTVNTLAQAFTGPRTEATFSSYVLLLLVYESLAAAFAIINVLYSNGKKSLFSWFLIWWAAASLTILSFAQERSAALAVQPLVPISLLAAEPIGHLLEWFMREKPLVAFGVFATVSSPPILLIFFLLNLFTLPGEDVPSGFAAIPVFVLVLAVAGSLYWRGRAYATRLWGLYCIVVLFGMMLHTTANLNYRPEPNPSELLRGKATTVDVRNLVSDVEQALTGTGSAVLLGDIVVDQPWRELLGWYLRKYELGFPSTNSRPLIIVGHPNTELPAGEWAMQRYSIGVSAPRIADLGQLWRWLIYREAPSPMKYDYVVMYISL